MRPRSSLNRRCAAPALAVEGISAAPSEDNLRYFNVIILGPKSSPYQGRCSSFQFTGALVIAGARLFADARVCPRPRSCRRSL